MHLLFHAFTQNTLFIDTKTETNLPNALHNLCTIAYSGSGIQIHHSTLQKTELEKHFKLKYFTNGKALIKKASIKQVLLWLKQHGGKDRFSNIVIIAGDMASRGINFACHDTDRINWHITHQILIKSDTTNASTIVQALRILGNHGDDIPLKLYTTAKLKEIILKSYQLTNELVHCIISKNHPYYQSEYDEKSTDEICKFIPLHYQTIPRKFLKCKKLKHSLRIVKQSEEALTLSKKNRKKKR
jgi:hypothetical protein